MHMGHYAAMNIHQQMLAECTGGTAILKTLNPFPAVIGLALGTKAVSYTPDEGTRHGEELLTTLFGDDMANSSELIKMNSPLWESEFRQWLTQISGCRNYLKLSEACQA